jgi:fatty acid kinase fatty acid binding subunit
MPYIRVVTDSACDIPDTLLRQLDITVVPFSMQWGEERYLDGVNITTPQLLRRLEEQGGPLPEALAPSVEDFGRAYRAMRETCDGVISLHVSAKLSDAQTNANIAREAFGPVGHGGPFPIAVVDSMTMSMGLGWIVLAVARAATAGLDLVKLVNVAGRLRGQTHFAFITEDMKGLSRLMPQFSSISSLRPLFHIEEGQIEVYERTRTRAKARDALYNFVEDFPKIGEMAVLHTGAQNDLEHLLTRVGAIYPRERVAVLQPGPTVTCWLGREALAVAVFEGEE